MVEETNIGGGDTRNGRDINPIGTENTSQLKEMGLDEGGLRANNINHS